MKIKRVRRLDEDANFVRTLADRLYRTDSMYVTENNRGEKVRSITYRYWLKNPGSKDKLIAIISIRSGDNKSGITIYDDTPFNRKQLQQALYSTVDEFGPFKDVSYKSFEKELIDQYNNLFYSKDTNINDLSSKLLEDGLNKNGLDIVNNEQYDEAVQSIKRYLQSIFNY